ncbi:phosphoribosylanthranilate isomerase [Salinibaculum rarum]|uniref:phosphoribosylanthranilate isomerase n=1 Tax=Salinibaculum rarum TaxID=3058903 RepID=UPI00265FD6AB|nr:phosphoribosylanthranilate isomerase [Salinibaculum sp. KK48]
MTRVKLCGITSEADRDAAVAAGADAVGFIVDVDVETPREITAERAADLVDGVPPFVTTVLVTMPNSVEDAVTLLDEVEADAIQVHSTLAPEYVGGLRARVNGSVLAAVGPDADLAAYADAADALLVDSVDSEGGGGTGETQDWERTRELVADIDTPVVLAGGLTPENVQTAIETVEPFAVDTASGVEETGGVKDHDAMATFVARATTLASGGVDA